MRQQLNYAKNVFRKFFNDFVMNFRKFSLRIFIPCSYLLLLLLLIPLHGDWPWPNPKLEYFPTQLEVEEIPLWIKTGVDRELKKFKNTGISLSELDKFYKDKNSSNLMAKFTVKNNVLNVQKKFSEENYRLERYVTAFNLLCELVGLPDTTFLLDIQDTVHRDNEVPILIMAKNANLHSLILIPDFEAVAACYQVLQDRDITQFKIPWESKIPRLIWRGGSSQCGVLDSKSICKGRYALCELSLQHPEWVDAGITLWNKYYLEEMPYLIKYDAKYWASYEQQTNYKYHILIDGNTCAYTASGWKFFSNSLIFKVDSPNIQWYYFELEPYKHYIPVEPDLNDLIDKLCWGYENDEKAKNIAENARKFALDHITIEKNFLYLYYLIMEYTKLLKE